jgi:molybdopterin-synthase adenylyltransferase
MSLTDNQIERYSRQIIVPGVGGHGQERLLASSVAIVAAPTDAASALAYLAGAGVGRILIHPVGDPVGDRAAYDAMIERTHDLNPDVSAGVAGDKVAVHCDLMLALLGDARTAEATARLARARRFSAAIVARLDAPGRIALMPAPPPCPLCAEPLRAGMDLGSAPGTRSANAGVLAMVAVAEAFKLLAGFAGQQLECQLIEFDGYASRSRALRPRRRQDGGVSEAARCVCEAPS